MKNIESPVPQMSDPLPKSAKIVWSVDADPVDAIAAVCHGGSGSTITSVKRPSAVLLLLWLETASPTSRVSARLSKT